MPSWQWAILAWACLWALQGVGVWFQMRGYTKLVNQLKTEHNSGFMGTGHSPSRLKGGAIAIVVTSPDLVISKAIAMSGFTIMAKFKNIPDLEGLSISQAKTKIETEKFKASLGSALNKSFDQIAKLQSNGGQKKNQNRISHQLNVGRFK